MKIGILQTGKVYDDLAERHGQYPEMFRGLLRRADQSLEFQTWAAVDGEVPRDPHAADAWLVTGSRFGVYDPEPWIEPLKAFLRQARAAAVPIVGICFGHQLMAEAFGGRAEKSDRGWGAGAHGYSVVRRPGWMTGGPDDFSMYAMHQDQVTAVPPGATVLAESPFCPVAMLAYGDTEAPEAISIQPHPEMSEAFSRELVELRADLMGENRAAEARASFGVEIADEAFARWVVGYLDAVRTRRNAA